MSNFQQPNGPPPPTQLPSGWQAGWSNQYNEHFYTNTRTGQSQWELPSQHAITDDAPPPDYDPGHGNPTTYDDEKIPVTTTNQVPASELPAHPAGNGYNSYTANNGGDAKPESVFLSDYQFEETSPAQGRSGASVAWSRKRSCRVIVKRFDRSEEEDLAKAEREITALSNIQDPAVPPLLEIFDTPAIRFLVLETLTDQPLKQYIEKNGPVPEDLLKSLVTQLFAGLAATFMAGLTHLRICDETLNIGHSGQLTIQDFHYAHEYDKEVNERQYALVQAKYGNDIYVAPEVFAAESYNGRKATLWSCGVVIYFMITGETGKLSNVEHPINGNMPAPSSQPDSRRASYINGGDSPRRMSLSGRKLSVASPPVIIHYPGSRFEVPSYARDIISKLLTTNPLKRPELIEVTAKVPKEIASKETRPLMELAWLDYKTHVGPLAGQIDVGDDVETSSVFSGVSRMSNSFGSIFNNRRRSSVKNLGPAPAYDRYG